MPATKSKGNEISMLLGSLRDSMGLLGKIDPLQMAGATAFFTTFALAPIVFILAQLFGFLIGPGKMGRGLIETISNTLGKEGADQVRQVVRNIRGFGESWYVIILGFLFLLFIATTLFGVIKNSFNQIWRIKVKERPGLLYALLFRLRSFAVILLVGLLFLADFLFEGLEAIAGNYVDQVWTWGSIYFKGILAEIGSVLIVSAWFVLLFRFLADGRPSWKASLAGGLLTGILFIAGRLLLRYMLVSSNISYLYGPSGSFVLVLLFVFYSSFILYYGACFITVYSEKKQWPIIPKNKAYTYRIQKIKNPLE